MHYLLGATLAAGILLGMVTGGTNHARGLLALLSLTSAAPAATSTGRGPNHHSTCGASNILFLFLSLLFCLLYIPLISVVACISITVLPTSSRKFMRRLREIFFCSSHNFNPTCDFLENDVEEDIMEGIDLNTRNHHLVVQVCQS